MQQLHMECNIPYAQMNDIQICVLFARNYPEILDMIVTKKEDKDTKLAAVEETKKAVAKESARLDDFQLVPKDAEGKSKFKGLELFKHMRKRRNANFAKAI